MDLNSVRIRVVAEDNGDGSIEAYWRGVKVGYAETVADAERVLLGDLHAYDRVRVPFLRYFRRTATARGVGLGAKLLDSVIAQARGEGRAEIYGIIVAADLAATPHLIDFYRRRGFRLEPADGAFAGALHRIVLRL